jgi:predicted O-methyltransferase YrrM
VDAERLIALEAQFAPEVTKGRHVFSQLDRDPHAPWELGGDKMASDRNNYAAAYADLLKNRTPNVIMELGVFRGESMALWCELFPDATVVGVDLDLTRYHEHYSVLKERGAFARNEPVLVEWDAFSDDASVLEPFGPVDLFVDDGPHTDAAIRNVARLVKPLMAPGSAYVVEDFLRGDRILMDTFPGLEYRLAGRWNAVLL